MVTYKYNYSSRSPWSIVIAFVTAAFGCLSWVLVFTSNIGFLGVLLAAFFTFGMLYSIYFYVRPVTWMLELSADRLRWQSPHWPRQSREISVSDIVAASITGGETDTVELRLSSGERICLPPTCVGRDPKSLVRAISESNPRITPNNANA